MDGWNSSVQTQACDKVAFPLSVQYVTSIALRVHPDLSISGAKTCKLQLLILKRLCVQRPHEVPHGTEAELYL